MSLAEFCSWAASIISITSVYVYGNRNVKLGAILGLTAQVPWMTIAVLSNLHGLILGNLVFASMHVRNLWKGK